MAAARRSVWRRVTHWAHDEALHLTFEAAHVMHVVFHHKIALVMGVH